MKVTLKRTKQTSFGDKSLTVYSNAVKTWLGAPISLSTGQRVTGLTAEDEAELEGQMGLEKGTLKKNSKFWDDYTIVILGNQLVLDDSEPEQALKLKVLKANKTKIAQSIKEWRTEKPDALFYIHSEEEEAKIENVGFKFKRKANSHFDGMSIDDMRDALLFYNIKSETLSNEAIEAKLYKQLELNPRGFLAIVEDEGYKTKLFVKQLVKMDILQTKGAGFTFEGEMLAYSLDKAVEYLQDKDNSNMLLTFKQMLQEKESTTKKK